MKELIDTIQGNYNALYNKLVNGIEPVYKKVDKKYFVIKDKVLRKIIRINNKLPESENQFIKVHISWIIRKADLKQMN